MWRYGAAIAFLVEFGVWTLLRVRQEYRRQRGLSQTTAAAVWLLYTLHLAITVAAAVTARWPLPLDRTAGLAIGMALAGPVRSWPWAAPCRSVPYSACPDWSPARSSPPGSIVGAVIRKTWDGAFLLAGVALIANSGLALLMAALFWASFRFYLPEERLLEHLFGDEYRRYRSRSCRYFGPPRTPAG